MRILTYTTLFPNREMPRHGIFVAERLRHLLATGEVRSTIMAPVPWFPSSSGFFGGYSVYARVPREATFQGQKVLHIRYPLIPKVGMTAAPILLAIASYWAARKYLDSLEDFDLIDAHYFYPDGVAAVILGHLLKKPVIITARGTDINLIPAYRLPRRWILWAARRCSKIISVSEALRTRMVELGISPERVVTLRNGVDLAKFRPLADRQAIRARLNLQKFTLLTIGHLIERKGHHLVIEAIASLPDTHLLIVGDGPMEAALKKRAAELNVADRVRWIGPVAHDELIQYYNAVDALVLASSREGMANVLLESLACGTPVVATPLWGSPEVVREPSAGQLSTERTAGALVRAIQDLISEYPDRAATRRYAEQFSWHATTNGQLTFFQESASNAA